MIEENVARQMSIDSSSGYWKVDDKCFFDKRECLLYASKIKNYSVTFHFMDDIYQSVDWDTEPTKTLDQLYCDRARQLREKYDYLILMFSGGSDSMNILDTFLNNNIRIDEIVTLYPIKVIEKMYPKFDINDKKNVNLMFEYKTSAEPKLKKISQSNPEIKISVIDWSSRSVDTCINDFMIDYNMCTSGSFSPTVVQYNMLGELVRDRNKTHHQIAVITGIDKPRVGYNPNTNKIGTWFDDISITYGNSGSVDVLGGFKPKIEYFYYTPSMMDVWKKQCIVLKRLMEPIVRSDPRPEEYFGIHYRSPRGNEVFRVHHNFFKKVLYSNWDTRIYQASKPNSHWYNETTQWFWTDITDSKTKEYYTGQLNNFISGIDPKFIVWNKEKNIPIKFIELATKPITIK